MKFKANAEPEGYCPCVPAGNGKYSVATGLEYPVPLVLGLGTRTSTTVTEKVVHAHGAAPQKHGDGAGAPVAGDGNATRTISHAADTGATRAMPIPTRFKAVAQG